MKFSSRLIVWSLIITALPMALIGYLTLGIIKDALKDESTLRLSQVQTLMQGNFERWINGNTVLLKSLAQRPQLTLLSNRMITELEHRKSIADSLLADHLNPALGQGGFRTLSLLNPGNGEIIVSTQANLAGRFRERSQYFIQGRLQTYVDKLEYNPTSGEILLHIATPVKNTMGQLVGVLFGSVDWEAMVDIFSKGQSLSSSLSTYLINSFSYPVVMPSQYHKNSLPKQALHSSGIDDCLLYRDGAGEYLNFAGTEVVGVYHWLKNYRVCLITEQESGVVFAPLSVIYQRWIMISLVTLIFAIGISLLITRHLLIPLKRLSTGVDEVSQGKLDYRIEQLSNDEIGKVGRAFNLMLDQVQGLTTRREILTREITQRELIEARLRDAETLYRTLFSRSPDGILLIAPDTLNVIEFNPAAYRMLGYSADEFSKMSLPDLEAVVDGDSISDQVKALPEMKTLDLYATFKTIEADTVEVRVALAPVIIAGRQFIHLVYRDISELLERVKDAQHSRERFERAIIEAPFPVLIHTEDGEVLQLSNTWNELTGYSAEEIVNTAELSEKLLSAKGGELFGSLEKFQGLEGKVLEGEFEVTGKNGQLMTWDFSSAGLGRLSDNRRIFMRMAVDVTERKRNQDKLEHSNQELEQFAYVASHDLQEPLRMISSYVQLLARRYKDKLDQDAHEFIGFAVDGTNRMQNLINDLLLFSRVESQAGAFEQTECEKVYQLALKNLAVSIAETGALITHDALPVLQADSRQLIQLFQNLIGNAIKFSRKGIPPEVHVSARKTATGWQFCVKDNGIGIEPAYTERIFVIFQRLHSREEFSGTGIGLAVCRKIVQRHGGTIWMESEPGQGSSFYFTLPDCDPVNA